MSPADALALVADAAARLWTRAGAPALEYLHGRGLTADTIRSGRLGWAPRVLAVTRDGHPYTARGITVPWFDGDRLALLKVRQPDGWRRRYAEAYRDRPALYPGRQAVRIGRPLVVVEGELDALLLGQELAPLDVAVVTLGSASSRRDVDILWALVSSPRWYIATDADQAGDRAAGGWPTVSRRVRPPGAFKDWTEAHQGGVNLRRWWALRLEGIEAPPLYTWEELSSWRWGPAAGDPAPGIVIGRGT
jgi:hypothetical protein